MGTLLSQGGALHTCSVYPGMDPQFLNQTQLIILSNKKQKSNIVSPTTSPSELT